MSLKNIKANLVQVQVLVPTLLVSFDVKRKSGKSLTGPAKVFPLFLILLIFSSATYSQTQEEVCKKVESEKQMQAEAKAKQDPITRSWIPILGYNPTYRFFFGGGFFFNKDKSMSFGINGIVTQDSVLKIETKYSLYLQERWLLELQNEVANGFEPNYGSGGQTKVEDRVDVQMRKNVAQAQLAYFVNPHFVVGPLLDYRIRIKDELPPDEKESEKDPITPREDTLGFGLHQRLDYRNIPENPNYGWYQSVIFKAFPESTQSGSSAKSFATFRADIRLYQYLFAKELVMAYQIAAGTALGTPSYLNEFRLGGTDELRGYYYNRFRGKKFYLQQSELRFPIFKAFSGASFLEFGEVTNHSFGQPHLSYGFGLRIGLPPDHIMKIRFDVAFSKDQSGVFLDFGHPF